MENNKKSANTVEKALQEVAIIDNCQSSTEAVNVYDNWSTYDETLAILNYNGPKVVSDALAKYLSDNKDVRVLDVAAGTGLVGVQLKAHGFNNIDALDASEGMLNLARQKMVYRNYIQEFFPCENSSVKTSSYDVVVVSGSISDKNLMSTDCLPEMVRCIKMGGLVFIVIRYPEEQKDGLQVLMEQLETEGQWQMLERTVVPTFYHTHTGLLFVFKVTKADN